MKLSASSLWLSAVTTLALMFAATDSEQEKARQQNAAESTYSTEEPLLVPMRCEPYPECVASPEAH